LLAQYQILYHTLFEPVPDEERSIKYQNNAKEEESLIRFRSGLASNNREVLKMLSNSTINSKVIDKIRENVSFFMDNLKLPIFTIGEMEME
jgi:hypothetical protein